MSESSGWDGLEKAVKARLDYYEDERDSCFARRDGTPWWQRGIRLHRERMAHQSAGMARAYGAALGLIRLARSRDEADARAGVREEERAYYHQEAERQEAQLAEDHERRMEAKDKEAGERG